MADETFKPTDQEIEFLKAKREADEANRVDMDLIRPGMSKESVAKVKATIARVWR